MIRLAFLLLALCGCTAPADTVPYLRAETVQIPWSMISEYPIRANEVLSYNGGGQGMTREQIGNPSEILAAIDSLASVPEAVPYDLRLVGLFTKDRGVDTLVVDQQGNAQWRAKRFRLTPRLATLLHVKSYTLNPVYHPRVGKWQPNKEMHL